MIVHLPSPLLSYSNQVTPVEARGKTLLAVLEDLERQFPGFLFRVVDEQGGIREHIRFYLGTTPESKLTASLEGVSEVHIIAALSGG